MGRNEQKNVSNIISSIQVGRICVSTDEFIGFRSRRYLLPSRILNITIYTYISVYIYRVFHDFRA